MPAQAKAATEKYRRVKYQLSTIEQELIGVRLAFRQLDVRLETLEHDFQVMKSEVAEFEQLLVELGLL